MRVVPTKSLLTLAVILTPVLWGSAVEAHEPNVIGTPDQHAVTPIVNPEVSRALYGELVNHPHTFEIQEGEAFDLFVEILVPDIEEAQDNISGIVLEVLPSGSVKEIARLHAKDAGWESFYEPWGGDSYRRGPQFGRELPPGIYRIEVSTPDNIGKYALVVGKKEGGGDLGYFETIRELARVKVFFGKSQFAIIQSPLVYVPLFLLIAAIFVGRRIRRRLKHA